MKFIASLLVLSLFFSGLTLNAVQTAELTLEQAISRVTNRDLTLVSTPSGPPTLLIERTLSQNELLIRQLREQARLSRNTHIVLFNTDRVQAEILYGQIVRMSKDADKLERYSHVHRMNIELGIRRSITNIAGLRMDLYNLENSIALQETLFEQTQIRNYHGMVSDVDVVDAELALEQFMLQKELLELSLLDNMQQFNTLLRHSIYSDITVTYDISTEPLPEDIDRFISRSIAENPMYLNRQDEAEARFAEWQSRLNDRSAPEATILMLRLEHTLALFERDNAERMAELNIRNALNEWERLLEVEQAIQAELEQAVNDYENMKSRYEAGFVTQIQVDLTAQAVAAQETRLMKQAYDFWIARFIIDHPYLYGR